VNLDRILDLLNAHQQRATYGAVADLLGTNAQSVMQGRRRDRRHSWVVNQKSRLPTAYSESEMHPALLSRPYVLTTSTELRDWLADPY
jgi:hypothetical protein